MKILCLSPYLTLKRFFKQIVAALDPQYIWNPQTDLLKESLYLSNIKFFYRRECFRWVPSTPLRVYSNASKINPTHDPSRYHKGNSIAKTCILNFLQDSTIFRYVDASIGVVQLIVSPFTPDSLYDIVDVPYVRTAPEKSPEYISL
jgi:hypothetical protein